MSQVAFKKGKRTVYSYFVRSFKKIFAGEGGVIFNSWLEICQTWGGLNKIRGGEKIVGGL